MIEADDWEPLAGETAPILIGVRHHSPSLARVMGRLLDAARPDVLMIELPAEAAEWLAWLTHPETIEPVSLGMADQSASGLDDPGLLAFYPFAAFSPELVALRWAAAHGVEVICGDLPVAARHQGALVPRLDDVLDEALDDDADVDEGRLSSSKPSPDDTEGRRLSPSKPSPDDAAESLTGLTGHLERLVAADHPQDVWDRLVEAPATGAPPEAIRRAALAAGWAVRVANPILDEVTAAREATMRQAIRTALAGGRRVVAVIGAFHAAALTNDVLAATAASDPELLAAWPVPDDHTVRASLVTGRDEFLDPRSGYPSGIRDPGWQRAVFEVGDDPTAMGLRVTDLLTRISARIRHHGHPCGPGETAEATRLAADLAALRGLPAPGRRELLEAMTSTFAQGEVLGRGRVVARAAQDVLVGDRIGRLPVDVPRSGVAADFDTHRERLALPERGELALEPLRNARDAQREIFLNRCQVAGIRYATPRETTGVAGAVAVRSLWNVDLTPATEASLAGAGALGVSVAQAASSRLTRALREPDDPIPPVIIEHLARAAEAGLAEAYRAWLTVGLQVIPPTATLGQLIDAKELTELVTSGLLVGATGPGFAPVLADTRRLATEAVAAAISQVAGLAGSTDPADAAALGRLARSFGSGSLRLRHQLDALADEASPLIRGAAAAALWDLGSAEPIPANPDGGHPDAERQAQPDRHTMAPAPAAGHADVSTAPRPALRFAELLRGAHHLQARRDLTDWLTGFLAAAPELLGSDELITTHVTAAIDDLPDAMFVARLPALRAGFDGLSPTARERLLARVGETYVRPLTVAPEQLVDWARADQAAHDRLRALGLADAGFAPATRWRLMLGRGRNSLGPGSRRLARSLDQLYGHGAGDGAEADRARQGGLDEPIPNARVWATELDELFGTSVREEVVAAGAAKGDPWAVESLSAETARPSVELLQTILSLRGAMSEATLARLRPLVKRIVDQLAAVLATKLRPALRGLGGHRRTLRNTKRLDAPATIRRNLVRAVRTDDGQTRIIATEPVFRQPTAKHAEWHVIVLVDVSGSMEPSTIFAALTSAILAGVPVLSVTFLTFSTKVIDLTEHVTDPLALLMEIQVGGGTDIGAALHNARTRVTNPTKTLLVLITDFYEGSDSARMLTEVRTLATAGVKLFGCAALDDTGIAAYHVGTAQQVVAAGMPVAAVTPDQLAGWVAEQINR